MSDAAGEKQFDATPKRRQQAARKGDVIRSRDLATLISVAVGIGWLALAGSHLVSGLQRLLLACLTFDPIDLQHEQFSLETGIALPIVVPVILLGLIVPMASMAAQVAFGEGRFVAANLAVKPSRLNPVSGLQRMFGSQGLIEMGKGILKVVLLGGIAEVFFYSYGYTMIGMGSGTLSFQLRHAASSFFELMAWLCAGLLVIAAIDLPLVWYKRGKRLKMTLQEVRDEHKESDGSPEMRAARRQRQRDIAAGSITSAMHDAQFVITNPTHFSIALAYDPAKAAAPIVLAKGRGEKAIAIRELATQLRLPVLDYPPLARSLYYTTRERQVIDEAYYGAVAAIVAFVLSLRRGETPMRPVIGLPLTLQFDAEGRPQT